MRDMAYDDAPGPMVYPEPERTSLAAILGFIFSLGGCCLAVPALLAVPLCILGIVNISRSGGRLGGRGLAIAGLILGLLGLAAWGSCLGGGVFSLRELESRTFDPTARVFEQLQQGQLDGVRANLLAPAADVSDAELIAFREAYRATLGDYVGRPTGVADYFGAMPKWGPWQTVLSNPGPNAVPVLFNFQQGDAMVIVTMDPATGQPTELRLYDLNLNEYTLPMQPGWENADTGTGATDATASPGSSDIDPQPDTEPESEPGSP